MARNDGITRRSLIKVAGAGAALALAGKAGEDSAFAAKGEGPKAPVKYQNADFYADGKFQVEKAKKAYFDMMERFSYPVVDKLKKDMWTVDFSLNDFVNVGMAGIFWWNSKEHGYFGHDIFLLPGQMIVEHAHVKTEAAKPKMEAWHVRHGMIYAFGEGDETNPLPVTLPESQAKFITVKHCQALKPGEVLELNRPEAKHFMIAGPEGAIVTEYATYHDGDGLRFTNPGVKF